MERGTHSFCFRLNIILFSREWHSFLRGEFNLKFRVCRSRPADSYFASLFCLYPYLAPAKRLNNISKTIKSSPPHLMHAIKDILSWYLIWLPDLRPPISALTTLTTLKTFKVALHWLWLPEWLELLASCDPRDGDKRGGQGSCEGRAGGRAV